MHRFNNMNDEEVFKLLDGIVNSHTTKKDEILNLIKLQDKKIEELMKIEKEYADIIFELHERKKKNVR